MSSLQMGQRSMIGKYSSLRSENGMTSVQMKEMVPDEV